MSQIEIIGRNALGQTKRVEVDGTNGLKVSEEGLSVAGNVTAAAETTEGKKVYVYGHDSSTNQVRMLQTDATGHLKVSNDVLEVHAENVNLNTDALEGKIDVTNTTLSDGSQICKVMGSEDATINGTQRQLHLDGSGNVHCSVVNTINVSPANSVNSHITDDPANSVCVGLTGRQTIGTATSQTHLLCNSDGKLEINDSKVTSGADLTLTQAQQNLVYGIDAFDTATLEPLRLSGDKLMVQSFIASVDAGITNKLPTKASQNKVNGSEVVYVSGQAVAAAGTYTGPTIDIDPNTNIIWLEHSFTSTDIFIGVQISIDGTNFFDSDIEINGAGGGGPGPVVATLSGINAINGATSSVFGWTPHIRFVFTNADVANPQTINSLSYIVQTN